MSPRAFYDTGHHVIDFSRTGDWGLRGRTNQDYGILRIYHRNRQDTQVEDDAFDGR